LIPLAFHLRICLNGIIDKKGEKKMTTRCYEVDGYGDRSDIALEKDRSEGTKIDNYYAGMSRPLPEPTISENAYPITEIVKRLIQEGKNEINLQLQTVEWDVETIHEAVLEACIYLGLAEEDFNPYARFHQGEIKIILSSN
jgi:hypothetical protein